MIAALPNTKARELAVTVANPVIDAVDVCIFMPLAVNVAKLFTDATPNKVCPAVIDENGF